MSTEPIDGLELRAVEQRNRLHADTEDLKQKISEAREKVSLARNVREHIGRTAILFAALAFLSGYRLAGMFTRR